MTSITDSQEPAYRAEHEIDVLGKRIRNLEAQLDALAELAADMARDLEDAPRGAWYAKRLRALIGGR